MDIFLIGALYRVLRTKSQLYTETETHFAYSHGGPINNASPDSFIDALLAVLTCDGLL